MIRVKSGEGGHTAVGLDTIYDGVQADVLHGGRAVMACRRNKSQEIRTT